MPLSGPAAVTIEAAHPEDAAEFVRLRGLTRENAVSSARLAGLGITAASWADDMRRGLLRGWVARHGSAIIGYCFGDVQTGEVVVLALLPAAEGLGLGRRLLDEVVGALGRAGHRRLHLGCAADPAVRSYGFYRHLGWRSTGQFDALGDEVLELHLPPPVAAASNLAMSPAQIAQAYDQLAERWTDACFNQGDGLAAHQRALAFLATPPASPGWALHVGSGCSTRFNALLRGRGLDIEAIDLSPRMVALARAADPQLAVHQGDICEWALPRPYAFISAWDSIWHVPLGQQRALMLKLMAALDPGGVLLLTAGGLDGPGEHRDASMGPEVYYATLGIPALLEMLPAGGCVCRHLELDQYPLNHLCLIVQRMG